jgi:hypothetical protein
MSKKGWIGVTITGAVVAMTFGPTGPLGGFWGAETAEELGIDGGLLAAFLGFAVIEGLAFGLGLAWLIFGRSLMDPSRLGAAVYLAIGWLLASWWPHESFHISIGEGNYAALARIEYGFHATMIVAGLIVARYIWATVSNPQQTVQSRA